MVNALGPALPRGPLPGAFVFHIGRGHFHILSDADVRGTEADPVLGCDIQVAGNFVDVDVCTEKDKLPVVFIFLVLNHIRDLFAAELFAGVLMSVGENGKNDRPGPFVFRGVLQNSSQIQDGLSHRIV
jgi:hypothetical protein